MRPMLLTALLVGWAGVVPAGTLHELAASADSAEELRKALAAGEDPGVADPSGRTPLEIAAVAGHAELVKILLDEGGANVDEPGYQSRTPLTALAANYEWADTEGLAGRLVASAKVLLEHGADVNATGRLGWTPLLLAAANGNAELVRLLLEHDPELDLALPTGYTALHQAAARGKAAAVRLLVEAGADTTLKSGDGQTAMALAEYYVQNDVIKVLKEAEAAATK